MRRHKPYYYVLGAGLRILTPREYLSSDARTNESYFTVPFLNKTGKSLIDIPEDGCVVTYQGYYLYLSYSKGIVMSETWDITNQEDGTLISVFLRTYKNIVTQ